MSGITREPTSVSPDATPLSELIQALSEQIIRWRRHLHRHPELSGQEEKTRDYIESMLAEMDSEGKCLKVRRLAGTGVVADITNESSKDSTAKKRIYAFRCDMDALPITEERVASKQDWRSVVEGVAHSCGHDGHMATMLGAAKILISMAATNDFPNDFGIRLIFEPMEEVGRGAKEMIEAGVLQGVRQIFGMHYWPLAPLGEIWVTRGPMMAGMTPWKAAIVGKGGHGSDPQSCVNPLPAAAQIVSALQGIVTSTLPQDKPAVVSVCSIQGGHSVNVVPDEVIIQGSIRCFSSETAKLLKSRLCDIVGHTAAAFQCRGFTEFLSEAPVVFNDAEATQVVVKAASRLGIVGSDSLPVMASEDFGEYQKTVPGCFFFLGGGDTVPLHHCAVDYNDQTLLKGVELWARLAERLCGETLFSS